MPPTRLLLIAPQPTFLTHVRTILACTTDIIVVGEALESTDAIAYAQRLRPDAVLLDDTMSEYALLEIIGQISLQNPAAGIILLTSPSQNPIFIFRAIKSGVRGCLLQYGETVELAHTIRMVAQGGAVISPHIAAQVLQEFQRCWSPEWSAADAHVAARPAPLTCREREILRRIVAGQSNKHIGRELGLADKTISNCLTMLYRKLQVADRAQAAAYAVQHGLLAAVPSTSVAPGLIPQPTSHVEVN